MTAEQPPADVSDKRQRRLYLQVLLWITLPNLLIIAAGVRWSFSSDSPEIRTFVLQHFAAIVGLPGAAMVALSIVTVLEQVHGRIEFEGVGFKFRGASGPVVLWVFCYLAIAASIRLVW